MNFSLGIRAADSLREAAAKGSSRKHADIVQKLISRELSVENGS
jgi:hypothetical protein